MTWLTGPEPDATQSSRPPAPPEAAPQDGGSDHPTRQRARRRPYTVIALAVIILGGAGAALAVSLSGSSDQPDLGSLSCSQLADRVADNSKNTDLVETFRIRCGTASPIGLTSASEDGTINGSIAVGHEIPSEYRTGYCSGSSVGSGYGDIGEGTQVVVKDPTGKIIATGALGSGTWKKGDILSSCVHPFTVRDIPKADFYTLSIGRRGDQTYSRSDLEQRGWRVDLTLG
jgi:hypothetical protein